MEKQNEKRSLPEEVAILNTNFNNLAADFREFKSNFPKAIEELFEKGLKMHEMSCRIVRDEEQKREREEVANNNKKINPYYIIFLLLGTLLGQLKLDFILPFLNRLLGG